MKFHPRRVDKGMPKRADQLAVLREQKFLTIAMSDGRQPYLVSMDYAFSPREKCFYVHCATEGRKLGFLRKNPRVWGQVLEDRGVVAGKCTHAYRCVMFEAKAEPVTDVKQKRRALALMVRQMESDPKAQGGKIAAAALDKVLILRLRIKAMSGKQSPPPKTGPQSVWVASPATRKARATKLISRS